MKSEPIPETKQQRIEERWKRIEAKLVDDDVAEQLKLKTVEKSLEEKAKEEVKEKIRKSRVATETKRHAALNAMSDVVKDLDLYELGRRKDYETKITIMKEKLATEHAHISGLTDELASKWDTVRSQKVPKTIFQQMLKLKKEYEVLLDRKKATLKKLEEYFHNQQEQYTELLKAQELDIRNLMQTSEEQMKMLQEEYDKQFYQVDAGFFHERETLLKQYMQDRDTVFEKRRDQELTMFDKLAKTQEQYLEDVDKLSKSDHDRFKEMKNTLDKKIQIVVQDLQDVRAKYQLNYEKLVYNHAVLKERKKDNSNAVTNQRKRCQRLKLALSNAKQKYEKTNKELKKDNDALCEDYKRITKQYKELGEKFKLFKRVDKDKYLQMWNMNDKNVKKIMRQISQADRVVHQQILRIPWKELNLENKTPSHLLRSFNPLDSATVTDAGQRSTASGSTFHSHSTHDWFSKFTNSQKMDVFKMLVHQADFLVEESLLEKLDMVPQEQHLMYKVDSIFHSLGVEDMEEIDEIIALYYDENGEMTVSEQDFMKVLRGYVKNRNQNQESKEKKSTGKDGQRRIREGAREKRYWRNMNKIIPEPKQRCWQLLQENLQKYLQVLQERSSLLNDVDNLTKTNDDLQEKLQAMFKSDVNHEFQIPPTALMDLSAFT